MDFFRRPRYSIIDLLAIFVISGILQAVVSFWL